MSQDGELREASTNPSQYHVYQPVSCVSLISLQAIITRESGRAVDNTCEISMQGFQIATVHAVSRCVGCPVVETVGKVWVDEPLALLICNNVFTLWVVLGEAWIEKPVAVLLGRLVYSERRSGPLHDRVPAKLHISQSNRDD